MCSGLFCSLRCYIWQFGFVVWFDCLIYCLLLRVLVWVYLLMLTGLLFGLLCCNVVDLCALLLSSWFCYIMFADFVVVVLLLICWLFNSVDVGAYLFMFCGLFVYMIV